MKLDLPKLQRVTKIDGESYYVTPEGNRYPSVTTVLSEFKKKDLARWRARVGEEEANRVKNFAAKRGTTFHALCEKFMLGFVQEDSIGGMFNQFKPYLNRIKHIRCLEQHVYSDQLKVAGQLDCVAEYDNCLTIIDFKTSSKPKIEKYIWDYFMQASAYSYMFEERTGIPIRDITILISCETGEVQEFYSTREEWIDGFKNYRNLYNKDFTE